MDLLDMKHLTNLEHQQFKKKYSEFVKMSSKNNKYSPSYCDCTFEYYKLDFPCVSIKVLLF